MKFSACFGLFTLVICAVVIKSVPATLLAQANADSTLMNYLLSPDTVNAAADPTATANCFSKYLPVLNEVSSTFQTQYQACITLADQRIATLTTEAASNRTDFITTAQDMCNTFTTCNQDTQVLNFFNCYASASSQDVSVIYNLSTEAASAAAYISQELTIIQNDKNTCINTTEKTYVDNTAATYKLLDSCLAAADASTVPPITVPVDNTFVKPNSFIVQRDCADGSGERTQTSADGAQTQTQTGSGCQSQSSSSSNGGSQSQSQSQSGSGTQSQTQCSGPNCGEYKPLPPLFTMPPMRPFN